MQQDTGQPGPSQPPKRAQMSQFRKVFLWTAIPMVGLAVIDLVLARLVIRALATSFFPSVVFVSLRGLLAILWVVALSTAIGFAIARKRQIAAGMFAGVGVGTVALGLTCFGLLI